MRRRLPLGTLLLLKVILVAGCGYQEETWLLVLLGIKAAR